jgi:flagellar protein FlaI
MTESDVGKEAVPSLEQKRPPVNPDDTPRHNFSLLKRKEKIPVEEYNFERHGTLVEPQIPEDYEQIDRYWVEKGRSLVVIALNKKTNQKEYLLFEPALSQFEYDLLERLHEDLRDVLILSSY